MSPSVAEGRRRYVAANFQSDVAERERVLTTIQEPAERFGVSTVTIRGIENGRLESFRVERERRVYVDVPPGLSGCSP